MENKIEVCLAVWKRLDGYYRIVEQLKQQTNQNWHLNVWNNSIADLTKYASIHPDKVTIHNSPENVGSIGRFKLVPLTTGNPILFIDDDLDLQTDFVEYMYQCWRENPDDIQGWFTRIFKTGYWDSIPYNVLDTQVDYVGTGGMILSREIFDKEPSLLTPPAELIKVEDLYLSYIAWKNNIKLYAVEPHCKIITDGKDQYHGLIEYKEKAMAKLRNDGWITLLYK